MNARRSMLTAVTAALIALAMAGTGAAGERLTAELVDVHAIKAVTDDNGHKDPPGKGGPGGGGGGGGKGKPEPPANCSNDDPGSYSGAYGLTGWAAEGPGTAYLNTSTIPGNLDVAATIAAMQASFDAWAGSGAPAYTVDTSGSTRKATANRQDDLMFGRTGGSLATAYTWLWSDGIYETDIVWDKGVSWFNAAAEGDGCDEDAGNSYDVANIGVHEVGHLYGLDHPAGSRFETMHAYGYSGETLKRSPATGDLAGIAAIYGP